MGFLILLVVPSLCCVKSMLDWLLLECRLGVSGFCITPAKIQVHESSRIHGTAIPSLYVPWEVVSPCLSLSFDQRRGTRLIVCSFLLPNPWCVQLLSSSMHMDIGISIRCCKIHLLLDQGNNCGISFMMKILHLYESDIALFYFTGERGTLVCLVAHKSELAVCWTLLFTEK